MSRIETSNAPSVGRSFARRAAAALAAMTAAASAWAAATPAGAVTLLSASMDTSYTAYINGPGMHVNAYIGPVTFHATNGGPAFDFTAYCVDLFHDMYLGTLNGGAGYAYHLDGLTTDSSTSTPAGESGVALSASQISDISSLLNYSVTLANAADPDLHRKQAGIQGAIWEIENPLYTVTASNAQVQTYINTFRSAAGGLPDGTFQAIYANDFGHQAFAYGTGGVPEPATWTVMIMGLGAMGAALRRRRPARAVA